MTRGWRQIPYPTNTTPLDFNQGNTLGFTIQRNDGEPKQKWCDRLDLTDNPRLKSVEKMIVSGRGHPTKIEFYGLETTQWTWVKGQTAAATTSRLERIEPCFLPEGSTYLGDCQAGLGTNRTQNVNSWVIRKRGRSDLTLEVDFKTENYWAAWLAFDLPPICQWEFVEKRGTGGGNGKVQNNMPRIRTGNPGTEWEYKCT